MSVLKDLQESHDGLKIVYLTLVLMPFWYFSLYLFTTEFYPESDLILKIVFCGIISIVSGFLNYFGWSSFDDDHAENVVDNMSISILLLLAWKAVLMFIVFSLFFFFKIELFYYWYIVIFFTPIMIVFLLGIFSESKK